MYMFSKVKGIESVSCNATTMNIVVSDKLFLNEDELVNKILVNEIYHIINNYLDDSNKYSYISNIYNIQVIFTSYRMHHRKLDACVNIHLEKDLSIDRLEELLIASLKVVSDPSLDNFKRYIKVILPHIDDWVKPEKYHVKKFEKWTDNLISKLSTAYVDDCLNDIEFSKTKKFTSVTMEGIFENIANTIMWYDIPYKKNKYTNIN